MTGGQALNYWGEVMGVTEAELQSIRTPTIIIPGNDKTHSSASDRAAHRLITGSKIHNLPVTDQDVDLIAFSEWAPHEDEITAVFSAFMKATPPNNEGALPARHTTPGNFSKNATQTAETTMGDGGDKLG